MLAREAIEPDIYIIT